MHAERAKSLRYDKSTQDPHVATFIEPSGCGNPIAELKSVRHSRISPRVVYTFRTCMLYFRYVAHGGVLGGI